MINKNDFFSDSYYCRSVYRVIYYIIKRIEVVFKRILIIFEPEDIAISRLNLVSANFHFLVIYTLFFFKSNIQCIF